MISWRPLLVLMLTGYAAVATAAVDLPLVNTVDLQRYAGRWYEIARLPNRFQSQCVAAVTADYQLRDDGRIDVLNRCRLADGSVDAAQGLARVTDDQQHRQLQVRFAPAWLSWLPLVWGDYWIVALADDYRYAAVSEPSGRYLWILSRSPQMRDEDYAAVLARLADSGLPLQQLQRTPQQLQ